MIMKIIKNIRKGQLIIIGRLIGASRLYRIKDKNHGRNSTGSIFLNNRIRDNASNGIVNKGLDYAIIILSRLISL